MVALIAGVLGTTPVSHAVGSPQFATPPFHTGSAAKADSPTPSASTPAPNPAIPILIARARRRGWRERAHRFAPLPVNSDDISISPGTRGRDCPSGHEAGGKN